MAPDKQVRRRHWPRVPSGVRARSVLAATLVVLVGAVVGSLLLLFLLQRALVSSAEDNAAAHAAEVANQVSAFGVTDVDQSLQANTPEGQLVQVLDANGAVVASSSARGRISALSNRRPDDGQVVVDREDARDLISSTDPSDPYLVVSRGVRHDADLYTVVVAASISAQVEAIESLVWYLVTFVPVAAILVAVGTWILVGRALRPVERIRSRVAGIGSEHLDERVPVPTSHDEVARLAATMNQMLERLESGQHAQRAFVSDASHELRSPLSTLAASLEISSSDPFGRTWLELKDVMGEEVSRMAHLVDDLLLLAKADDHGLRMRDEEVDLDDLMGSEVRRLRRGDALEVAATLEPARIVGDRVRLEQMLRNLVDNAAAAAYARVSLSLRVDTADEVAVLAVDDDGEGVPVQDRKRVFERFARLDSNRSRDSGGSGLGLAIAREIARGHGGVISVESSGLGGARFVVRLPIRTST